MARTARKDWTEAEIEVVVESYFRMLRLQLEDRPFVKAREVEWVRERIERSRGSVEFKYQNISAAVLQSGFPEYVRGYVPLKNLQKALLDAVERRLATESILEEMLVEKLLEPLGEQHHPPHLTRAEVPNFAIEPRASDSPSAVKIDFLAIEQARREVGLAGELAVVAHEKRMLHASGRASLASRVEHVSQTRGDGLGYDVLSFDHEGDEKFIEVKTTRWQRESPFLVTRNEVAFSESEPERFHLYRVFDISPERAAFYPLKGPLSETCTLRAASFVAHPL